ncbi:MAG: GNAT family N-acetyltransferase [Bacillota bacterium]
MRRTSDIEIVRVDDHNYPKFDDMVFWRMSGRERTDVERLGEAPCDFAGERAALANPNLFVYAAHDSGKFVGWISIVYLPKVGRLKGLGHLYVDELWVEPTYRRRGIAARLLKVADELLDKTASAGVRLYVNTDNPGAKRLYEKCGFRVCDTAYFMEKDR